MAAFTIDYQPQFVQSDIGAMQKKFNELQSEYDQSYLASLAAQDQYSSLQVDPRDINMKNEIIGGFKNRINDIVTQYGGDWGAASKAIANEIVKTKQDPFFQLAPVRMQLAEEQRRRVQALGPNAIIQKNINDISLKDENGKYIDPSSLSYDVLDRTMLKGMINSEYGHLAKNISEGAFTKSKDLPGSMERTITTGITDSMVPDVAQKGAKLLMDMVPGLSSDIAYGIALEEAKSYVGDSRRDFQNDKNWDVQQQKDMYAWQLEEKKRIDGYGNMNPEKPENPNLPYRTTYDEGIVDDDYINNNNDEFNKFKDAAVAHANTSVIDKKYPTLFEDIRRVSYRNGNPLELVKNNFKYSNIFNDSDKNEIISVSSKILRLYDAMNPGNNDIVRGPDGGIIGFKPGREKKIFNNVINSYKHKDGKIGAQISPSSYTESNKLKAIEPFKNDETFKELVSNGMNDIEAAQYVAKEKNDIRIRRNKLITPNDKMVTNYILDDLSLAKGGISGAIDLDNNTKLSPAEAQSALKNDGVIIQFNNSKGTMIASYKDGSSKDVKHIEFPISNLKNEAVSNLISDYSKFNSVINGRSRSIPKTEVFKFGNYGYEYDSEYNPLMKDFERVLVKRMYNNRTGAWDLVGRYSNNSELINSGLALPFEYGLSDLSDFSAKALFDTYGLGTIYKEDKRNE